MPFLESLFFTSDRPYKVRFQGLSPHTSDIIFLDYVLEVLCDSTYSYSFVAGKGQHTFAVDTHNKIPRVLDIVNVFSRLVADSARDSGLVVC